jgi:hypothetical protein
LAERGEDVSLLEYYGDPILLGRPANRPGMVARDLAAYRSEGVRSVSTLVFGTLSWWLYPLQLYGYAKGSWDPAGVELAAGEYCQAAAGEIGGELLARYYRLEGEAAGTHLRFCGYGSDGSWATLPLPPMEPADEVRRHSAEMERGQVLLREASGLLNRVAAGATEGSPLGQAVAAHRLEEGFHRSVAAHPGLDVVSHELAIALHGVLRSSPPAGAKLLVLGGGTIGLLTVAAIRRSGSSPT